MPIMQEAVLAGFGGKQSQGLSLTASWAQQLGE